MRLEEEEKQDSTTRCDKCHRSIAHGESLFKTEEGVLGPRGFISLDNNRLFCSEACLSGYFDDMAIDRPRLKRRVP